jgi:chemotaxis family two-component system sensor histidine kinase/response regulator PixL
MRRFPTPPDILLVDDDPNIRHCMTALLELQGYAVAIAADGWQALEYLRQNRLPRLILLDLVMPEMDGWEFLHQRRHNPELRPVPVVVLSAVACVHGPDAMALGAAGVLDKPFRLEDVLATARRYCDGRCSGSTEVVTQVPGTQARRF